MAIYLADGNGNKVHLTPRQAHITSYVRSGYTLARIAEVLGVDKETVKYHITQVKNKLGVYTIADVIEQIAALWILTFGFPLVPSAFRQSDSQIIAAFASAGKEVGKEVGKRVGTSAVICGILFVALAVSASTLTTVYAQTPVSYGTPMPRVTPMPRMITAQMALTTIAYNDILATIGIGFILSIVLFRWLWRFI